MKLFKTVLTMAALLPASGARINMCRSFNQHYAENATPKNENIPVTFISDMDHTAEDNLLNEFLAPTAAHVWAAFADHTGNIFQNLAFLIRTTTGMGPAPCSAMLDRPSKSCGYYHDPDLADHCTVLMKPEDCRLLFAQYTRLSHDPEHTRVVDAIVSAILWDSRVVSPNELSKHLIVVFVKDDLLYDGSQYMKDHPTAAGNTRLSSCPAEDVPAGYDEVAELNDIKNIGFNCKPETKPLYSETVMRALSEKPDVRVLFAVYGDKPMKYFTDMFNKNTKYDTVVSAVKMTGDPESDGNRLANMMSWLIDTKPNGKLVEAAIKQAPPAKSQITKPTTTRAPTTQSLQGNSEGVSPGIVIGGASAGLLAVSAGGAFLFTRKARVEEETDVDFIAENSVDNSREYVDSGIDVGHM